MGFHCIVFDFPLISALICFSWCHMFCPNDSTMRQSPSVSGDPLRKPDYKWANHLALRKLKRMVNLKSMLSCIVINYSIKNLLISFKYLFHINIYLFGNPISWFHFFSGLSFPSYHTKSYFSLCSRK